MANIVNKIKISNIILTLRFEPLTKYMYLKSARRDLQNAVKIYVKKVFLDLKEIFCFLFKLFYLDFYTIF